MNALSWRMRAERPPARRTALKGEFTLGGDQLCRADREPSIGQDPGAQAAISLERVFGAGREGGVQPLAGPAGTGANEAEALQFELGANQRSQINAGDDHVAAQHAR